MGILLRRAALLLTALAVIAGSVVPLAAAGSPSSDSVAVAAAKKKCKKKKGAKAKKKCKKKGGGASTPSLPGKPLSPTPSTPTAPPAQPPAPALATVTGLTVAETPILGGDPTSGEVTISDPASSGGQAVALQSSDPSRVSVPSSVHVAAGQTKAAFAISTSDGATVTATITASIGTSSRNVQLTAVADPSVESLELAYQCFPDVGLVNVGGNRVTLDVPAPSDTPVSLSSSAPDALSVPSSVTVPDGASSALFAGVDTLAASGSVTVTASLNSSTKTDTASVRDGSSPAPVIADLTLNPTEINSGGSSTATVTLDCEALAGGATVAIASDNPTLAPVPAPSVVVPQNALSTTFTVTPVSGAGPGTATISGTLGGTRQAVLTITDLGT